MHYILNSILKQEMIYILKKLKDQFNNCIHLYSSLFKDECFFPNKVISYY